MFNFSIPMPTDAQSAVRSANRLERAHWIIEDGYTFLFDELTETVDVVKPGRLAAEYTIFFQPNVAGYVGCDCPDMIRTGEPCKHYLAAAIVEKQAEEAYQCAELEARYAEC